MASFADQIKAAKAAHSVVTTMDATVRVQIAQAFADWEAGKLNDRGIRTKLEALVRSAYRASASVGTTHVAKMAELGSWEPRESVFTTDYLKNLLKDVRSNLSDYKKSPKEEADRRRAVLRIQHSAGVGAEQGYTDALVSGFVELEDFGYETKKFWVANFKNNVPCKYCRKLHGTSVPLTDEFTHPGGLKVYGHLQGCPLHPNCHCQIIILLINLENALEPVDFEEPDQQTPETMDTDDVKKIPDGIFKSILKTLKAIAKLFRKKK